MPKVNRKGQAEVLSQDQLAQLWTELKQPHRLITQLAYYTASRINEVCALRAEDISAGKIVIRQSKTERDQRSGDCAAVAGCDLNGNLTHHRLSLSSQLSGPVPRSSAIAFNATKPVVNTLS